MHKKLLILISLFFVFISTNYVLSKEYECVKDIGTHSENCLFDSNRNPEMCKQLFSQGYCSEIFEIKQPDCAVHYTIKNGEKFSSYTSYFGTTNEDGDKCEKYLKTKYSIH